MHVMRAACHVSSIYILYIKKEEEHLLAIVECRAAEAK